MTCFCASTFLILFFLYAPIFAQDFSSRQDSSAQQSPLEKNIVARQAHFGWGLGYSFQNLSVLLQNRIILSPAFLNLQFSTFFAHSFSPVVDVTFTANFSQSSGSQEYKGYFPVPSTASAVFGIQANKYATYSIIGDLSAIVSPFTSSDTDWRNLRFGLGPSARVAGFMSSWETVNSGGKGEREYTTFYTRQHALGGHLFLEYLLPISPTIDVTLRTQATSFALPFYSIGDDWRRSPFFNSNAPVNLLQSLSIGAFLRVNL